MKSCIGVVSFFLALAVGPAALAADPAKPADKYRLAADYSKEQAGLAVLVLKDGKIVFEEYQNGHTADKAHHIFSGTKSFAGVMAACAVEDGLLKFDDLACDTITEWKDEKSKNKITIRQLLSLTDGLDQKDSKTDNLYKQALGAAVKHEPGTKFEYGSGHYMVFGEIMRRKLADRKEDPLAYLERRVLKPIGLKYDRWLRDQAGNPLFPYGAFLTAREWAKFGELIRQGGKWQGKQIVAAKPLAECFVPTKVMPAYGLTFWLTPTIYPGGPRDTVKAAGYAHQYCYIIPSRGLVVVRFGAVGKTSKYKDDEFLSRLLEGKSLAAEKGKPDVK